MRPLVSIITLTYNQERFLPACLEGVRLQAGDFDLEHWIVDDASSDSTPDLLAAHKKSSGYPVHVLRHKENRGANFGMAEAYAKCRGEFVALCEGDDFWTAPDKLQAQVTLMRRRPDLGLCYHDAILVREDKRHWPVVRPAIGAPVQSLDDLLHDNRCHTCTVMYRRIPGLAFPDWYTSFTVGDWLNHAFHAAKGGIGYLRRAMAVYRLHGGGSWSAKREQERAQELSGMLQQLDAHFLFRYTDRIRATRERILADASQAA